MDADGQIRALTHLVTVLVARMAETDGAWCRELLAGLKADRDAMPPTADRSLSNAFDHAIAIVERAISAADR
jgi:hypothetical protein